jgi:PAS domain S-box-containing protein
LALSVVDATGRVVFVNDEFSHLVGHTAAELVSRGAEPRC